MSATFDSLRELDARLATKGFYSLGEWWLGELQRLYEHPTATTHAARVGRGGKKSQTIVTVGLNELLFGGFDRPLGEVHFWTHVSENKDEASKSLRYVDATLTRLGIGHEIAGETITIPSLSRGYKVLACRVGALSGWRSIGLAGDELAKWSDDGSDPSAEVIASGTAMLVTHVAHRPKRLFYSSPLGNAGFHFDAVERGTTAEQIASVAPTWIANTAVTEEQTRALEKDERVWRREYLAEPSTGTSAVFDPRHIAKAFAGSSFAGETVARVMVIDPSSGRKDTWSWGVLAKEWLGESDGYRVAFEHFDGVEGKFFDQLPASTIVDRVAAEAKRRGITDVHSDQREAFALKSLFEARGLRFHAHNWTSVSKPEAVARVRAWFRDGSIKLAYHAQLDAELHAFEERITPSGAFTFGGRGEHDDFVSLLLTGSMVEMGGGLRKRTEGPKAPPVEPCVRSYWESNSPPPSVNGGSPWNASRLQGAAADALRDALQTGRPPWDR